MKVQNDIHNLDLLMLELEKNHRNISIGTSSKACRTAKQFGSVTSMKNQSSGY